MSRCRLSAGDPSTGGPVAARRCVTGRAKQDVCVVCRHPPPPPLPFRKSRSNLKRSEPCWQTGSRQMPLSPQRVRMAGAVPFVSVGRKQLIYFPTARPCRWPAAAEEQLVWFRQRFGRVLLMLFFNGRFIGGK